MNSSIKEVIIFGAGALVGGLSTWLCVKGYYQAISDREIEEVRAVYEDKANEIEYHKNTLDGDIEGPKVIDVKEKVKELNNKPDLTDYTKYFKDKGERLSGVSETLRDAKEAADKEGLSKEELAQRELDAEGVDFAEMEGPQDDEPYSDEEDREEQLAFEDNALNGDKKKAIEEDRAPYLIDASDYDLTCANYEKMSLTYYIHEDYLVNEENEIIDSVSEEGRLIGDILESSGFDSNDDDVIYVRNDKIMCDFEITKTYTSYEA